MSIYTYEWRYGCGIVADLDDPGPCVVDDAPHTTCTSADYRPIVISQTPARDALVAAAAAAEPQPTAALPAAATERRHRRQK